jgi:hypothetical protein
MISRSTGTIDLYPESDDDLCYPSEAWADLAPKVKHLHLVGLTSTSAAVHPPATQADVLFQISGRDLDTPDHLLVMFSNVGPSFRLSLKQDRSICFLTKETFLIVLAKYEEPIKMITLWKDHSRAAFECSIRADLPGMLRHLGMLSEALDTFIVM